MRLEQTPRQDQTVKVTTRLVTSSTILHLSADELEQTIHQEQTENPALEVTEQSVCLFCSTLLYGQSCTVCGRLTPHTPPTVLGADTALAEALPPIQWEQQQVCFDIDNDSFNETYTDDYRDYNDYNDEHYDPLALIATSETLTEELLHQLETLIPPTDAQIAEQLVGNLNERGYLEVSPQEIAELLEVPLERVNYVHKQLQTLEPVGIGARNLRECLFIQLTALSEQSSPHPLAFTLIDRYLDHLGHNQFAEIARQLKVPERDVRQASNYIRTMLHPFPAHIYHATSNDHYAGSTTYIHPDVIIRRGDNGFEVELMEEKRYNFNIETDYPQTSNSASDSDMRAVSKPQRHAIQRYMYQNRNRAHFFVDCIQRRWRTLRRVAEIVVDYQQEFLEKGVRYLTPLTRARVASDLHLDEGTVSRATANKYALLPNGRLLPMADFFDSSLKIKDMLRELIQSEDPKHRLSDEELARILTAQGIRLARRTVTKYREAMGIGSSRERGL
jgi:RNA polymerase sigma-54 factor